jgi:hypothetical protein
MAEQMERLHADIGTLQRPLEHCAEVLNPVGVDFAINVFLSVVDEEAGILV